MTASRETHLLPFQMILYLLLLSSASADNSQPTFSNFILDRQIQFLRKDIELHDDLHFAIRKMGSFILEKADCTLITTNVSLNLPFVRPVFRNVTLSCDFLCTRGIKRVLPQSLEVVLMCNFQVESIHSLILEKRYQAFSTRLIPPNKAIPICLSEKSCVSLPVYFTQIERNEIVTNDPCRILVQLGRDQPVQTLEKSPPPKVSNQFVKHYVDLIFLAGLFYGTCMTTKFAPLFFGILLSSYYFIRQAVSV